MSKRTQNTPNPYESPQYVAPKSQRSSNPGANCHGCGHSNFYVWSLFNPLLIHWLINPGLAVNELLLGQRIPKQTFVCRHCGDWRTPEFQFYECPGCQRKHSSKIWIGRNAFGNWHGLVCPDCEAKIPCLTNVFSLLIWVVLSPILLPLYLKTNTNFRSWSARRNRESRLRLFPQNTAATNET